MEDIETINPFAYLPSSFKEQFDQQSLLQQSGDQSLGSLSSLAVGFGNVAMYADQTGLRLGNVKTSSAPFGVDMNGNVHATTLQISGNQIVSGTINGQNVNITNLNASNITTGSLSANFLNGGTIDANNISVIHLNASNITTGTLSASFISGGTLVLGGNNNGNGILSLVDSSNNEVVRMNNSGLIIRNNQSVFAQSTGGQQDFFKFYNNGSSQGIIQLPNTNQFIMLSSDGQTNYFTVSSSKIFCNYALWVNSDFHFGDGSNGQAHDFFDMGTLRFHNNGAIIYADGASGGRLHIDPGGGKQIRMEQDIDMNNHNINAGNTAYFNSYQNSSDRNLKKSIISLKKSLELLNKLRPVSFYWKSGDKDKHYGFIAQEVEKILPELVNTRGGVKTLSSLEVISLLVSSVQELSQKVDKLLVN